jgi:hypothetical protein
MCFNRPLTLGDRRDRYVSREIDASADELAKQLKAAEGE